MARPTCKYLIILLATGAAAAAQPATTTATQPSTRPAAQENQVKRPPLLREGSVIVEAQGRLNYEPTRQVWVFVIESEQPDVPDYELTVLPCSRLRDLERIVKSAGHEQTVFQMTGRVFVYDNRNYLLPQHTPRIVSQGVNDSETDDATDARDSRKTDASPTNETSGRTQPDTSSQTQPTTRRRDPSVRELVRELDRAAGPLVRGSRPDESQARHDQAPVAEGTSIVRRRGRMRRDKHGAFLFVFDADAEGKADPPMVILPCLLLERMHNYTERAGRNAPMLITGEVYAYYGENYLLPTAFHIPNERTPLKP